MKAEGALKIQASFSELAYAAKKKVRYKGLAKNTAPLFTLFGLANLLSPTGDSSRSTPEVRPERAETMRLVRKPSANHRIHDSGKHFLHAHV